MRDVNENDLNEGDANEGEMRGRGVNGSYASADDALDRALAASLRSMRDLPEEPLRSVAGEVMGRLVARERRLIALRWTTVVGAAALAGVAINSFGLTIFTFMYKLLLHGDSAEGVAAYTTVCGKLAGALSGVVETLSSKLLRGTLGTDLGSYGGQAWLVAAGAAAVVILVMYLMSVWLGKPKEGKRWLARRSLHNGLQVW